MEDEMPIVSFPFGLIIEIKKNYRLTFMLVSKFQYFFVKIDFKKLYITNDGKLSQYNSKQLCLFIALN